MCHVNVRIGDLPNSTTVLWIEYFVFFNIEKNGAHLFLFKLGPFYTYDQWTMRIILGFLVVMINGQSHDHETSFSFWSHSHRTVSSVLLFFSYVTPPLIFFDSNHISEKLVHVYYQPFTSSTKPWLCYSCVLDTIICWDSKIVWYTRALLFSPFWYMAWR